jgi:Tol biopolymer transport system component
VALAPGTRLGSYEVIAPIGAGGMGEVYRARDTKLNRDVALKVLPAAFAADADRLARFKREAQVLASLNHPNIAAIYGFEDSGSTHALVLELVEGATLADRIARGPISLDEALPIARQIAEALEAAHEQGIVHRDLKPANVKLRPDGTVKVLDFGLAKALEPVSGMRPQLTNSPTITTPAMTHMGVILGTVAYMSPEQTKGRPADKRSDVWAFGCVLYEMLTANRAFAGDDVSDTLANVLKTEPDWAALPREAPQAIRRLVRRALEKDRSRRLADIADARLEIEDAVTAPGDPRASRASGDRLSWRVGLPWVLSVLLALTLAVGWLRPRPGPREPGPTTRLELELPDGVELITQNSPGFAISPDGTRVAFIGVRAGARQLYVRRLDESHAVPVRQVSFISGCCIFSPDSDAVGFIQSDLTIGKVTLADSLYVSLATGADYAAGATWTADGRIIFVRQNALWEVSAAGGPPQPLLPLDREKGEVAHAWPTVIAGTNAILFTSFTGDRRDAHIETLSLATKKRQVVVAGTFSLYTASGHLVFFRDGALLAVPFDTDRLTVTGTPVPVVHDVAVATLGGPLAAVSRMGALVYTSTSATRRRLVWVTRQGLEQPATDIERDYSVPRLAPDGRRIAVAADGQLWIYDTQRATFTRITTDDTIGASYPLWTPDGTRVLFHTPYGMQWIDSDGTGRARVIPDTSSNDFADTISRDGDTLGFVRISPETSGDIYRMSLHGEPKPHAVLNTPAYEGGPEFSPDGRWLAYVSNDSGQMQVYVRPVTGPDRRWPVSTQGGRAPKWSRSGRELFYLDGQKMMMVSVPPGPNLTLSSPVLLFEHAYAFGPTTTVANYDVSPDGQRFLMVKPAAGSEHLNLVVNWFEELKRLVPTK